MNYSLLVRFFCVEKHSYLVQIYRYKFLVTTFFSTLTNTKSDTGINFQKKSRKRSTKIESWSVR